jgi:hypothetical protein
MEGKEGDHKIYQKGMYQPQYRYAGKGNCEG